MNFRNKYLLRNKSIKILSWLCGLTSLTLTYTFIKWQKLKIYGDIMYDNLDLGSSKHIEKLYNSYFKIGDFSLVSCLLMAFALDLIVRRYLIRVKI